MIKNNIQWALYDPKTKQIAVNELYTTKMAAKEGKEYWDFKGFKIIKVKVTEVK